MQVRDSGFKNQARHHQKFRGINGATNRTDVLQNFLNKNVCPGRGCLAGEVKSLPGEGCVQGEGVPRGGASRGCLPRVVSKGGCTPPGYCMLVYTIPCGQTDTHENNTSPQTSFASG